MSLKNGMKDTVRIYYKSQGFVWKMELDGIIKMLEGAESESNKLITLRMMISKLL